MKGLVILAVLAAVIGGSIYALVRPSDIDLERIEEDIGRSLADTRENLAEAVRVLNPLRAINPTLGLLDSDLAARRQECERFEAKLAELRAARPSGKSVRSTFIAERKQVRADANRLLTAAADLRRRAELTDELIRTTQPRVQTMLALVQSLVAAREHREAKDGALDAELALKVAQLVDRAQETRSLAAQTRQIVMRDAVDGENMAKTIKNDVEQVIVDLKAAIAAVGEAGS